MKALLVILSLGLLAGCTSYNYRITQPEEFRADVTSKAASTIQRQPLEYRLKVDDNRLIMRIYNRSERPIQLLGEQSVVVDPRGESHPLRSKTIARDSYITLIFPPRRPRIDAGPTFGVGVGVGVSRLHGYPYHRYPWRPYPMHDPWYREPRYFVIYDQHDLHWNWPGEGEIQLTLVFKPLDQEATLEQEFTIQRQKA